jgi:phosphoserine phosphatase
MSTAYCFDLDGTVTTTEILPSIASELGVASEIATLTRLTMDGRVSFEDSLRLRALILGQVPLERIHEIIREIPLDSRIAAFIDEHRANCFIVTGNLDLWIAPMAARLGCGIYSSQAQLDRSRLRLTHVLDKAEAVADIRRAHGFERIVAVGDGANDVPMLREADIGISFGGVHTPGQGVVNASDYVIHEGESLCTLLKAL